MLSQKAYAAENHVAPSSIKRWYDKGYMPGAERNDCTGEYKIPADTQMPYHGKGLEKVTKIPTLMIKLLEAAESAQSVFPSMFPRIAENGFQHTLDELIHGEKVVLVETENGAYLHITATGVVLKDELETLSKKDREKLNSAILSAASPLVVGVILKIIEKVIENSDLIQQLLQPK